MKPRLLLALSGTKQSLYASELAFKLAVKTEASVTAQHVIDTFTSWEFLKNDQPGLLKSDMYNQAYLNLKKSQKEIADELIATWQSFADRQEVEYKCFIDEGNPVKEICKRARKNDIVIVGHRQRLYDTNNEDPWHGVKYTVAEGLAHDCTTPVLIVQKPVLQLWKKVVMLETQDYKNEKFLEACQGMSAILGAKTVTKELEDISRNDNRALLVIPTRMVDSKRVSVLGEPAELLVRRLSLPAILLWPEESAYSIEKIDNNITQEVNYESSYSSR
ncbi:MAG: universal stress protein [Cyanobacteria bacterium TGS_CYA1]|nr:universal stress protein [Cyanobacteria bacterium TGS_CYA1]